MPIFALMGSSSKMRGQSKEQSTYGVMESYTQLDSVLGAPCEGRASEKSFRASLGAVGKLQTGPTL